jgi:FAD dependent oxidoreductase
MTKQNPPHLIIIGGGVGGCACALAACQAGLNVVMTEETDWMGGQFTTQATPPDEHGWIEEFGCTANYREFRNRVRQFYRQNTPLSIEAQNAPFLNPGNGWVSPLCAEPKVFLQVLTAILMPFVKNGQLKILTHTRIVSAASKGDFVQKVVVENTVSQKKRTLTAPFFIDATELGDVLPLTNTEFVTGSESQHDTHEPSAKAEADPNNVQAFSMCFAMSYHENQDFTIEKPLNYDYWRDFVPNIQPAWSGRLLSLTGLSPRTLQPVHYNFQPNNEPNKAFAGLWTYRRIVHKGNFRGGYDSDITLVNYPQIDYLGGDLIPANYEKRAQLIAEAKQQSLSFLYYLQTELGFKGLKLRPDVVGTSDGLAKSPYIRESRRIKAAFTIAEQHVAAQWRPKQILAEQFTDSVGVGFYRIDLHPSVGGDNYVDVESLPFQIPLGALIPQRMENILPVCKNIGTTHITNGCYRLHPIEWNIGESVGFLLAFCLKNKILPREVLKNVDLLRGVQNELVQRGVQLAWQKDLILAEGDPHRHAL